ncbi:hypothetical protein WJX73_005425 [Symbiochloris irregularis]|uniref:JmjC domain-containing protein n=1 Tax=Symbiochloris irregularis TaxID=706552 RepID=A0AAW1P005_9CHLO
MVVQGPKVLTDQKWLRITELAASAWTIVGKRSKKDATHSHFDCTASLNIALATSAEDVSSVLALWLLIFPTALYKFSSWCLERGKTLGDPVGPELTQQDISDLPPQCIAVAFHQGHGSVVHLPAGWTHAVFNKRPCIKFATAYMERQYAARYALVQKMIATRIGPIAVSDSSPISVCALHRAIIARHRRRRD